LLLIWKCIQNLSAKIFPEKKQKISARELKRK
jgi:hypothetical protein